MRFAFLALLAITISPVAAADIDPFAGPKPIFVFIETDPWLDVIGSDTPRLALYENGELIFTSKVDGRFAYRHESLDAAALERFKQHLAPLEAIRDLRPWYNIAPNATDQPNAQFYFRTEKREIVTQVYGLVGEATRLPAWTVVSNGSRPDRLPKEMIEVHHFVSEYENPRSPEWLPPCVEVMLWPYEYAPEESIHWPPDWPGLDSPWTRKRGDMYHVMIDGAELRRVEAFLQGRREKGAVEVSDKKWAAGYRYVFPNEPIWREAFRAAPESFSLTFRDRIGNVWSTIEEAVGLFVHFWVPSVGLTLLTFTVGMIQLRAGRIPFSVWRWLLIPWLIPAAMLFLTALPGWHWSREQLHPIRLTLMALLFVYVPVAVTVIAVSRRFRWFALSIALFQTWITFCVLLATISATW